MIKVISFSGPLPNPSKDRIAPMGFSYVINQLHNDHGFPYTRSTKKTNLSSAHIRSQKIHHLNSCYQDFCFCGLVNKGWRFPMNGEIRSRFNRTQVVNRFPHNVYNTSQSAGPYWHANGIASINHLLATHKPFCGIHGNRTHRSPSPSPLLTSESLNIKRISKALRYLISELTKGFEPVPPVQD